MDVGFERVCQLERGDPQQIGGYVVLGRLGVGGIGVVYLARSVPGQLVAIKVVHRELAEDPHFRQRLRAEVEQARRVPAFCTAPFLDANVDHHPPYVVTGYLDGPTLGDNVEQFGPMSQEDVYAVAAGVAAALTVIHAASVIHRDLKPRHVLLAPDGAKVIDFGIGLAFEQTRRYAGIDTGAFTAPEHFSADPALLTPAADIFEWGAVVAFAATGRAGPEIADLNDLTVPLRGLVQSALQPNPEERPTARRIVDVLFSAGMAVSASHPVPIGRSPGVLSARIGGLDGSAVVVGSTGGTMTIEEPPPAAEATLLPGGPRPFDWPPFGPGTSGSSPFGAPPFDAQPFVTSPVGLAMPFGGSSSAGVPGTAYARPSATPAVLPRPITPLPDNAGPGATPTPASAPAQPGPAQPGPARPSPGQSPATGHDDQKQKPKKAPSAYARPIRMLGDRSPVLVGALMFLAIALVAGGAGLLQSWRDSASIAAPVPDLVAPAPAAVVPAPSISVAVTVTSPPVPNPSLSVSPSAAASTAPPRAVPIRPAPPASSPPPATRSQKVRSDLDGKCLHVQGPAVVMMTCSRKMTWQISADGTVRHGTQCLAARDSGVADGTTVGLAPCKSSARGQKWRVKGTHDMVNTNADKCLDITAGNVTDGAPVQLWTCVETPNQHWTLS
jgi:hypothetical protein